VWCEVVLLKQSWIFISPFNFQKRLSLCVCVCVCVLVCAWAQMHTPYKLLYIKNLNLKWKILNCCWTKVILITIKKTFTSNSQNLLPAWISLCKILVIWISELTKWTHTYIPMPKTATVCKVKAWETHTQTHIHILRAVGSRKGTKCNIRYSSVTVYTQEWLKTQWSYSKTNESCSIHPQCYVHATHMYIILLRQLYIFLYDTK
jgi:hypothetical protein